ncbi:MAG: L,D-transpeptidase family protein [Xanthobacteraceae bacterium]
MSRGSREKGPPAWRFVGHGGIALVALLVTGAADPAGAVRRHEPKRVEAVASRPAGTPLMAIISLASQRVTIYDADGWILRAPVSSGQSGRETPAGIYSVIQKEAEHYSNLYDDASMPHMQRITWSGIALHGGPLPGYAASHGCVRMPYDFAEHLFDITSVGMRVLVAPEDVDPAPIDHPKLFKLKPVPADRLAESQTAHWTAARAEAPATTPAAALLGAEAASDVVAADAAPGVAPPKADAPAAAKPPEMPATWRSIAAAKSAQAAEAARRADAARTSAARLSIDAMRVLRAADGARYRSETQVAAAENALKTASTPAAIQQAEEAKAKAQARLADAEAQLAAAKADAQPKADAAAQARDEARAAEAEKAAAADAAREATRMTSPVSVFISRKTQRLYVRQAFQPVLESAVTIRDADRPIGTHVYTVLDYANGGAGLRWDAVSLDRTAERHQRGPEIRSRRGDDYRAEAMSSDVATARAALDRIDIPQDVIDRISEVISPGSALIISDEAMSSETGKGTDFVVLMSGEPQGGIKMRHRAPAEAQYYDRQYDRVYQRSYGRAPSYGPSLFGGYGGGSPFYRW